MARQNLAFLLGAVMKEPVIQVDDATGEPVYGICFVRVVRGFRETGDHKKMKSDHPVIMSREPAILREMSTWRANDIVHIKGVIAAKAIEKGSYCRHCGQKNRFEGTLVYINPVYARMECHLDTEDECFQFLTKNREVSNQVYLFGTVMAQPKKLKPKEGLTVTQYPVAINRKYRIRTDPPEIKTDVPWVKSYGENATHDAERLHTGSQIFIDGCLQARNVSRRNSCTSCGEKYDWRDRAMEVVPYEVEYIANFYSDDEVLARKTESLAERSRAILEEIGIKGRTDDGEDDVWDEDDGWDD